MHTTLVSNGICIFIRAVCNETTDALPQFQARWLRRTNLPRLWRGDSQSGTETLTFKVTRLGSVCRLARVRVSLYWVRTGPYSWLRSVGLHSPAPKPEPQAPLTFYHERLSIYSCAVLTHPCNSILSHDSGLGAGLYNALTSRFINTFKLT